VGTLGELYRSYFLEMLYILQLWFSAWRTVILRGDLGSPRALWGQKALLAPLRGGEALRAIRVPNRHGLKAAQQPPAVRSSSAHSSRARSAEQVGAGAAQQTETAHLNQCVGRRVPCYPSHHAGAARLQRDYNAVTQGTAVLTKTDQAVRARLKVLS
jgi:hypothetical protein